MAELKMPPPGKLIVGFIMRDLALAESAQALLEQELGPVENKSSVIDFDFTDYYEVEMGKNLLRLWLSFGQPIVPDKLLSIKLKTIELEKKFFDANGNRTINLDPGILTLCNLILATTKNYYHRIYLGQGIYAEVTLVYRHNNFEPLAWTYPDYRTDTAINYFTTVRKALLNANLVAEESLTTHCQSVSGGLRHDSVKRGGAPRENKRKDSK